MDEFKKIELRMSELRTDLNANLLLDEPTPEEIEKRSALQTEYGETEKKYQEHLRGQISEEQKAEDEAKPEVREYRKLEAEVSLAKYLGYAIEGRAQPEGAELEFSQLLKIGGMSVPLEALAPRAPEMRARVSGGKVEERVDAATTIAGNADVPLAGHPILGRIFAYSDIDFLALTQVMAGVGEQTFPVLTGGVSPAYAAPGAAKDAEQATYTFTDLAPLGYAARYLFRREDVARLPMFEESLRPGYVHGDGQQAVGSGGERRGESCGIPAPSASREQFRTDRDGGDGYHRGVVDREFSERGARLPGWPGF